MSETTKSPARYIMIGGFLGAGKTTAVAQLAQALTEEGLKVGLITNDQGSGLVDTASLRSKGFATEEIPGGCFCCRFNSLVDAADRLNESSRPDVFIAEPVGSCTDLVATVTYPLRRMYGDAFRIAPLSVLVDPIRAQRILGLAEGGRFSEKVTYIYRKQLEEANLIVINKIDLLSPTDLEDLKQALSKEFPQARVLSVSARKGDGLGQWFHHVTTEVQAEDPTMPVDYDVYADGEALLGWLNATIDVRSEGDFDGNALVGQIAEKLQSRLAEAESEIAHLKMTLARHQGLGDLAVINVVRNDLVGELGQRLDGGLREGQLILNLRAEADPAILERHVREVIREISDGRGEGFALPIEDLEQFRPGRPEPTHRDLVEATS